MKDHANNIYVSTLIYIFLEVINVIPTLYPVGKIAKKSEEEVHFC